MQYESYNEIRNSYKEMRLTYDEIMINKEVVKKFFENKEEIVFLGCGSSYWLSLSAYQTFHLKTGKKTYIAKAADVAMAPENYKKLYTNPVFVAPSRSGESKELLVALTALKEYYPNAQIFSITEFEQNSLKNISDLNISIPMVEEISICQTRSFNCLYLALILIAGIINDQNLTSNIDKYLKEAPVLYEMAEKKVIEIVEAMDSPEIVTLGSGVQYGAVIEGAYIAIEMAQQLANYYQILEYRHGPIVTSNKNTFAFICHSCKSNDIYEREMAQEIKDKKAKLIMCCADDEDKLYDYNITISSEYDEEIKGLYFATILQLTAYYLSLKNGHNPDKPGELVKYITY